MSVILAQISINVAAVVLGVEAFQLYSDGHVVMGVFSFVLFVALIVGFYTWAFFHREDGVV